MIQNNKYLYQKIVDAKMFIDDHYDKNIELKEMAKVALLSRYHFHRIFKKTYCLTPLGYLTSLRIKKAKELLSKGYSTQHVCLTVGFESTSSFIKLFKKKERVTPLQFSKAVIENNLKVQENPLDYIPTSFAVYLGWQND